MAAQAQPLPEWIEEAALLYARGHSTQTIANTLNLRTHDVARYYLKKAGYVLRPADENMRLYHARHPAEVGAIPLTDRALLRRLNKGDNGHLDRGLDRLEAQIADDMTRNGSAFTQGD